jgi:hypothetical protein
MDYAFLVPISALNSVTDDATLPWEEFTKPGTCISRSSLASLTLYRWGVSGYTARNEHGFKKLDVMMFRSSRIAKLIAWSVLGNQS